MKIYVVNLVVNAKNTDIYDKVSLNKYPIVIKCNAEHELKKILNQDTAKQFLLDNIKSQKIYETAQWYIRCIYENDVKEICWDVKDVNTQQNS